MVGPLVVQEEVENGGDNGGEFGGSGDMTERRKERKEGRGTILRRKEDRHVSK